jgi:apolipoprotein N-acyltransferase
MSGMICYTLALPRFDLYFFAWLAPFFWTPVIGREKLAGNFPYRKIYLAAVLFWLTAVHWICCIGWPAYFGWIAMSFYLAFFMLFFFAAARSLVHRWKWPVVTAMPVAWVAGEGLQRHLLGGFSFAAIEHTQFRFPLLIQFADLIGEYGVGAFIIFIGAVLGRNLPVTPDKERKLFHFKKCLSSVLICAVSFSVVLGYGYYRVMPSSLRLNKNRKPYQIALLQGTDVAMLDPPDGWHEKVYENYLNLVRRAVKENPDLDLMIWPESTSLYPWSEFLPPGQTRQTQEIYERFAEANDFVKRVARYFDTAMLYGTGSYVERSGEDDLLTYNSALLIERHGKPLARYDKMQLVIFGEYLPFADWLPDGFFLKTLCQRADRGQEPRNFPLPNRSGETAFNASVNICFESSIPQLIREQVLTLRRQGHEPDLLINISYDGWFHHSSQIDMHLATHVFRAIENRKPYLSAANAGFSAFIDSNGNIIRCGPRKVPSVVPVELSDVRKESRIPPYHYLKDWISGTCVLLSLLALVWGIALRLIRLLIK